MTAVRAERSLVGMGKSSKSTDVATCGRGGGANDGLEGGHACIGD